MKIAGRLLLLLGVIAIIASVCAGVYLVNSGERSLKALEGEPVMVAADREKGTINFPEEYDHFVYVRQDPSGWNYCIGKDGKGVAAPIGDRNRKEITRNGDTFIGLGRISYSGEWTLACSDIFIVTRGDYEDAFDRTIRGPIIGAVGAVAGLATAVLGALLLLIDAERPSTPQPNVPAHVRRARKKTGTVLLTLGLISLIGVGALGGLVYGLGVKSFERAIASDSPGVYVIPGEPTTKHIEEGRYYEILLFPPVGPAGCNVDGPDDFGTVFSRKEPLFHIVTDEGRWSKFSAEPNFRADVSGEYSFKCGGPLVLSKKDLLLPARAGQLISWAGILNGAAALLFGLGHLLSARPRRKAIQEVR